MARDAQRDVEIRVDGEVTGRHEATAGAALGRQQPRHRGQDRLVRRTVQDQRAPGNAQMDAQRRLVGSVTHDVADDRAHPSVRGLHHVEEVAAEYGQIAAGLVIGRALDHPVAQQRAGQQTPLQPAVLCRQHLLLAQRQLGRLGAGPLDGVPDRAVEQFGGDVVLDEVVLRAGGDRLDAGAVVAAGQHDDRGADRFSHQAVQRAEALGVGQPEVEQHAPRRVGEGGDAIGEGALPQHVHLGYAGLDQALAHQQRVTLVVLDEQHTGQKVTHGGSSRGGCRGTDRRNPTGHRPAGMVFQELLTYHKKRATLLLERSTTPRGIRR